MDTLTEPKFCHAEGLTLVNFDSSGKNLVTAGADGDVKIYNSLSHDEVLFSVGKFVTALSVKDSEIAVGTDTNDVKTYSLPQRTKQDILVRFTAQVNSICFGRNSNYVAAGASDFSIKVVDQADMSQKQMKGHEAPVLCVAFNPDDQLLASSSCDGTLKIWDIAKQECLKSMEMFPKCNDTSTSKILCKIVWCFGETQVIAIPSEKGVKLISTENWTELCMLEGDHTELVSIVKCSPCGRFLASSSINGEIAVWDLSTRTQINFMKHDTKVTAIDWNPNGAKEVVYADTMGRCGVFRDAVPLNDKGNPYSTEDLTDESDSEATTKENTKKRSFQIDDDDDDDEPPIGSAHKKHRVQNLDNFLDDEAGDDDDDDEYDENNISLALIKEGFIPKLEQGVKEDELDSLKDFIVEDKPKKPAAPVQNFQKPFQPGATPEHLMHRFMVWNSVGIIRCHSEDEISTIDIEFHDASLHHPLHYTNVINHTMAALSTTAAVLACRAQDDESSKIVCLHFGTWDAIKEWTVSMTKGEDIMSVAVNSRFIAVATSIGLVRIFTVGGLQFHVFSIAGPVVTMSMCETQLMIVYHQATGKPPSQCLAMQLLEIGKSQWKLSIEQQLPIGYKDTLVWVGFSAEETPLTVDSKGIMRMLQRRFGYTWTPVLNLKAQTKTKSDNYWVIGITENPPEARAVLCKAANFPATLPRPVPSALPFQIPLCDKDSERGKLEESLIRNRLASEYHEYHKRKRLELDETGLAQSKTTEIQLLMKLFALSCKSDRMFRAVEICELMPNADTVNLAIQYATKMRRMNLAQRLVELARRKAEEEEGEDDVEISDYEESDDEPQSSPNLYQKPIITKSSSNAFNNRHPRASMYNGRRSIGRPKAIQRSYKDSNGSFPDQFEVENKEEAKVEKDNVEEFDGDDIDLDADIEMEQESNEKPASDLQSTPVAQPNSVSNSHARSNPFRLTPKTKAKAASTMRGTSYFESLKSTLPPKNKLGLSSSKHQSNSTKAEASKQNSKQATLFSRKAGASNDKSKESNQNRNSIEKNRKVTGFMLFREHLSTQIEGLSSEELVSKSLEEWKSLSAEEKKTWNAKAKGECGKNESLSGTHKSIIVDANENDAGKNKIKTLNEVKEKTKQSTNSSKSKLAGFAFKKT